jgi:hypothetical protein
VATLGRPSSWSSESSPFRTGIDSRRNLGGLAVTVQALEIGRLDDLHKLAFRLQLEYNSREVHS